MAMTGFPPASGAESPPVTPGKLAELLARDLDFHGQAEGLAPHDVHPFPAKFPAQLPRKFIAALTDPGDTVLDPMMGSGTTVLEAYMAGRRAVGFDIDPLAVIISKVKLVPFSIQEVSRTGPKILERARLAIRENRNALKELLKERWDARTREFVDYWFAPDTQIELLALMMEIERISCAITRDFFKLIFSGIIITKSGGVSLALDLAHTRPHRAKLVLPRAGQLTMANLPTIEAASYKKVHVKTQRSAMEEFAKRFRQYLRVPPRPAHTEVQPHVAFGNAQHLPLPSESVDLIVTSPPYASNAIDYMRAHKFVLVWMGYGIDDLSQKRKEYIGSEDLADASFENLPPSTANIIRLLSGMDRKRGRVLHRYYSEMARVLREMFRVLKPNKTAIVVVGSSKMKGMDTETQKCLADIGSLAGFDPPLIGVRRLDRDRRMMPAGLDINLNSQIQQRMHEEYVIAFHKPHG